MKLFISIYSYILILSFSVQIFPASSCNRLIWIIDETGCESLQSRSVQAETAELSFVITGQQAPVIVSRNILLNYVARRSFTNHPQHPENLKLKDSPFYQNIWRVFKIKGATYYLLIPEKYLAFKKASLATNSQKSNPQLGLHFQKMEELTSMLPKSGDFYRNLRHYLQRDDDSTTLADLNLSQIFITKNTHKSATPSWVFYMTGHGAITKYTVGTKVTTMHSLLTFFEAQIKTKLVYLSSCFLGGSIKLKLLGSTNYSFILVIGSITDSSVCFTQKICLESFFKEVEDLPADSKQELIAQACSHLTHCEASSSSSHGILEYPQVLVGTRFIGLDIDGRIGHIERSTPSPKNFLARLKKEEEEDDDDEMEQAGILSHPVNKIALLLYDPNYTVPIHVSPTLCFKKAPDKTTPLSFVPCTESLLTKAPFSYCKKFPDFEYAQPLIDPFFDPQKTEPQNCMHILDNLAPRGTLFPLFISMQHNKAGNVGPLVHHFTQVNVHNEIAGQESPFFGLQRFFRDAFFDTSERASKNIFLFDELNGFNDFSLFAIFFLKENNIPSGRTLLKPVDSFLSLKNVIVVTQGRMGSSRDEMAINISFTLEGFSWHYSFLGKPHKLAAQNPWYFTRANMARYVDHYNECASVGKENYVYQTKFYAAAADAAA